MTIDIADGLRGIGMCASREALLALLAHATKGRLSPAQVVEQIVLLERRERDARNLASRTKKATLGAMKPLDRFDWSFPRVIDRPRYEQLLTLGFTARGERMSSFGDRAASARAPSPRTSGSARSKREGPSASRPSTPRSPIS